MQIEHFAQRKYKEVAKISDKILTFKQLITRVFQIYTCLFISLPLASVNAFDYAQAAVSDMHPTSDIQHSPATNHQSPIFANC